LRHSVVVFRDSSRLVRCRLVECNNGKERRLQCLFEVTNDDRVGADRTTCVCTIRHLYNVSITRMLVINVSIPNLTVARLEQFRSPQLRIQRERPTDAGVD